MSSASARRKRKVANESGSLVSVRSPLARLAARMALVAVLAALVVGIVALAPASEPCLTPLSPDAQHRAMALCPEPPLCHSPRLTRRGRMRCALFTLPLTPGSVEYESYVLTRLDTLGRRAVKGQYVLPYVQQLVRRKLRRVEEPLVFHFAGDNGVGKTTLANVISLAFGQRCDPMSYMSGRCERGDSTLDIAGNAFDGLTVAEFRRTIVRLLVAHAQRFPHNGVVIINELSSLHPDKVRVLLPLLGRGTHFPEYPKVSLRRLTVVLTTDFGREGRTRGKNIGQLRALIDQEFRELYNSKAASFVRTFPFMPIALDTAAQIVRLAVSDLACFNSRAACQDGSCHPCVHISDDAVAWIVEKAREMLLVENGRALVSEVENHVAPLLYSDDGACSSCQTSCEVDLSHDEEGTLALYPRR